MNKFTKVIRLSMGVLAAFFMLTATAASSVSLDATHRVVSSVDGGNGLNSITMEITLNNTAGIDMSEISLELVPDRTIFVIDTELLSIDSLSAGSTTTVNWTVNSPMPAEFLSSGMPLTLMGNALDNDGQAVFVIVSSAL